MVKSYDIEFQSPQWGSNSKVDDVRALPPKTVRFQSPQWGSNSKGHVLVMRS